MRPSLPWTRFIHPVSFFSMFFLLSVHHSPISLSSFLFCFFVFIVYPFLQSFIFLFFLSSIHSSSIPAASFSFIFLLFLLSIHSPTISAVFFFLSVRNFIISFSLFLFSFFSFFTFQLIINICLSIFMYFCLLLNS